MNSTEQEINRIRLEIKMGKIMIKDAIRKGALFEEIKEKTLHIKKLQARLDELLAAKSREN